MPQHINDHICAQVTSLSEHNCAAIIAGDDQWPEWYPETYLLIHALDGVLWGRVDADQVRLQSATVQGGKECWQQIRIFDAHSEVLLWYDGDGRWQGRRIDEIDQKTGGFKGAIDENQLLWGNRAVEAADGFTELQDRSQGLIHILPKTIERLPVFLRVRHYIQEDEKTGFARIAASRLVGFVEGE